MLRPETETWTNVPPTTLSETGLSWFCDAGSLTKRLKTVTHNEIEYCLFFNDWDEKKETWLRIMEWRKNGATWMHCIVSIPKTSLIADLKNVGNRPIGEILFADATLKRTPFEYCEKDGHHTRQSFFYYKEKPLKIIETFFPAFFEAIENKAVYEK